MIEVELPDGRIIEVDTDDPQAAARAARLFLQQEAPPPAAPSAIPPGTSPDAMTPEQRNELLALMGRDENLQPLPVEQPTGPQGPLRSLVVGAQGVGRGLADLLGTPVDLATVATNAAFGGAEWLVNQIPGVDVQLPRVTAPVGGSENIAQIAGRAAEAAGAPLVDYDDLNTAERLGYNASRLGTSALAGGAGLTARGMQLAARGARPSTFTQPYAEAAERAASAPVGEVRQTLQALRPLASDVGAGTTAGLALTAVEPLDSPVADLAATLLGGMAGASAVNIASAPRRAVQTMRDYALPDPDVRADLETGVRPSRAIVDEARRIANEKAVDPQAAQRAIREGAEFYRDADMAVPTSGLLSNDEGLIGLENVLRREEPAPFMRRDREVAQSASDQVAALQPRGNRTGREATEYVRRGVEQRRERARAAVTSAEERLARAEQAEQRIGATAASRAELADDASRRLDRTVVDETMRPMQQEQARRYADIDPEGTVQRDVAPLVDAVRQIRESVPAGVPQNEVLPERWLQQFERLAETGEPISFRDINRMRPFLSRAIESARSRGDYSIADSLRTIKGVVDSEAERLAAEGSPAGVRAQEAVRYTREEFAPLFGRGEGGRLRADINADDITRSNTPPTATAGRFLRAGPGGREVAEDLRAILNASPSRAQGMAAARDYVLADLAKVVGSNGTINPSRLRRWIENRQGVFSAFPEIEGEARQMLRDVVNGREATTRLQQELRAATASQRRTDREIQNSALSLVLDADPVVAVRNVFRSRDPERAMAEITKEVRKDKDAFEGWKKAIADYLEQTVTKTNTQSTAEGARNVSLAELTNLFTRHEKVLQQVYTPGEMQTLRRAQRAVQDLSRRGISASVGSTTAENMRQAERLTEIGLKLTFGGLRGGNLMRSLRMAASSIPGLYDEEKALQLLRRAMLDPELAATLLHPPKAARPPQHWSNKIRAALGIQQTAGEAAEGDE